MYENEGKAVAFHVMKPCIGFIQGFFLYLLIEDSQRIDYNIKIMMYVETEDVKVLG